MSNCRCEVYSLACPCGKNLFPTWHESFFWVHFSFGSIEEDSPDSPFHRDIWSLTRPVGELANLCTLGSTLVLLSISTLPTQSFFTRMSWLTRDFTLKGNVNFGWLKLSPNPKHLEFLSTWHKKCLRTWGSIGLYPANFRVHCFGTRWNHVLYRGQVLEILLNGLVEPGRAEWKWPIDVDYLC